MTEKTLNKVSDLIRKTIENLRTDYKNADTANARTLARAKSFAYTQGLKDAEVITETERKALFIYTTV